MSENTVELDTIKEVQINQQKLFLDIRKVQLSINWTGYLSRPLCRERERERRGSEGVKLISVSVSK